MREFVIEAGSPPKYVRALVCGLPKHGKTHFAASAPRPLFISDAAEGGYKTLQQMDPQLWWDPATRPVVWAIERMEDMPAALKRLEDMVANFPYGTVIVDPLSIYVDRVLAELMLKNPAQDNRRYYGDLANHLRSLVIRMHALPCHVLWLCHVKADGGVEANGPAIGGQMGAKFPAFCDFAWFCNVTAVPNQQPVYELRTKPFRSWTFLGGRWKLPDPLIPSFKHVALVLGLDERPVSPMLPGGISMQAELQQPQQQPQQAPQVSQAPRLAAPPPRIGPPVVGRPPRVGG